MTQYAPERGELERANDDVASLEQHWIRKISGCSLRTIGTHHDRETGRQSEPSPGAHSGVPHDLAVGGIYSSVFCFKLLLEDLLHTSSVKKYRFRATQSSRGISRIYQRSTAATL